jgi:pilus assembly protein CpaC
MADQTLPTDFYREPNDAEFYILGAMQGRHPKHTDMFGRFDGEFGHALPQ